MFVYVIMVCYRVQLAVGVMGTTQNCLDYVKPGLSSLPRPKAQDQKRESLLLQLQVPAERQGMIGLNEIIMQGFFR